MGLRKGGENVADKELWFNHEGLEVYKESLAFIAWLSDTLEGAGRVGEVKDQLDRASTSIPLNIAEGNGKYAPKDRCRFFDIAHGSALECAAGLDILVSKKKLAADQIRPGKQILQRIVRMLMGLIKRYSTRDYEPTPRRVNPNLNLSPNPIHNPNLALNPNPFCPGPNNPSELRRYRRGSMPIKTKRWIDPIDPDDGLRVLVCRYRPRGVAKADEVWDIWEPSLGPSKELHAAVYTHGSSPIPWERYRVRYLAEQRGNSAKIAELADRVRRGETVTLLCSSACERESRCHRSILKDLIESEIHAHAGGSEAK